MSGLTMNSPVKSSGTKGARRFRVFAITFAAVYAVTYYVALVNNWPLFSYGPAVGQWTLFNHAASDGPTMYWYGWIATSAIVAGVVALIVSALPEDLGRRLWSSLAWLIPVCAIVAIFHLLSGYFTH
jgi:hypothetical protein